MDALSVRRVTDATSLEDDDLERTVRRAKRDVAGITRVIRGIAPPVPAPGSAGV